LAQELHFFVAAEILAREHVVRAHQLESAALTRSGSLWLLDHHQRLLVGSWQAGP
jgi:hypothetical protein